MAVRCAPGNRFAHVLDLAFGYRLLHPTPFLTVNDIWDDPQAWHGQRVTVRGWVALEVSDPATQNECYPNLCQCVLNETDFILTGRTAAQKSALKVWNV